MPLPLFILGAIAGIALFLLLYLQVFVLLVYTWVTNNDYSHCFLVPCFSAYLLWRKRSELREAAALPVAGGRLHATILVVSGLLLRFVGLVIASQWFARISFIPLVIGLTTIKWNRGVADLARPAVLFLIFMIPLPDFLGNLFNAFQHVIVTSFGTYLLQTLGIPAVSAENMILLTDGQIDVTQGGRGLYLFLTLVVGACLIFDRMRIEKIILVISAIPICIVANSIGIVATGVTYEFTDTATAELVFNVTGWLMLPLGLLMVWGVFFILNRLFVPDD